jgi:hypothetical protein
MSSEGSFKDLYIFIFSPLSELIFLYFQHVECNFMPDYFHVLSVIRRQGRTFGAHTNLVKLLQPGRWVA